MSPTTPSAHSLPHSPSLSKGFRGHWKNQGLLWFRKMRSLPGWPQFSPSVSGNISLWEAGGGLFWDNSVLSIPAECLPPAKAGGAFCDSSLGNLHLHLANHHNHKAPQANAPKDSSDCFIVSCERSWRPKLHLGWWLYRQNVVSFNGQIFRILLGDPGSRLLWLAPRKSCTLFYFKSASLTLHCPLLLPFSISVRWSIMWQA